MSALTQRQLRLAATIQVFMMAVIGLVVRTIMKERHHSDDDNYFLMILCWLMTSCWVICVCLLFIDGREIEA